MPSASTTRQTTWTDSQQAAQLQIGSTYMETNTYIGAGNDQLTTTGTGPTSQDQTFNTITGIDSVARYTGSSLVSSFSAIRDPSGQLLALQDNSSGARYYPLYDNQGSVLRLVDANGNTVDSYSYDAYGTRTTSTNTYPQPFGYTGAYTNPTTGLIHYGARFYDPTLGRFTQPDPQTHPGDISQSSPYPYAGNDPINLEDSSGELSSLSTYAKSRGKSAAGGALQGAVAGAATGPQDAAFGAVTGGLKGCATGAFNQFVGDIGGDKARDAVEGIETARGLVGTAKSIGNKADEAYNGVKTALGL